MAAPDRVELRSCMWAGHYEQYGAEYPQRVKLEFADGLIRGDGVDAIGAFAVNGEYRVEGREVRLGWIKTYDGAHSVLYLGTLESGRIVGSWDIAGYGGEFALSPAPREEERAR